MIRVCTHACWIHTVYMWRVLQGIAHGNSPIYTPSKKAVYLGSPGADGVHNRETLTVVGHARATTAAAPSPTTTVTADISTADE